MLLRAPCSCLLPTYRPLHNHHPRRIAARPSRISARESRSAAQPEIRRIHPPFRSWRSPEVDYRSKGSSTAPSLSHRRIATSRPRYLGPQSSQRDRDVEGVHQGERAGPREIRRSWKGFAGEWWVAIRMCADRARSGGRRRGYTCYRRRPSSVVDVDRRVSNRRKGLQFSWTA